MLRLVARMQVKFSFWNTEICTWSNLETGISLHVTCSRSFPSRRCGSSAFMNGASGRSSMCPLTSLPCVHGEHDGLTGDRRGAGDASVYLISLHCGCQQREQECVCQLR